MSETILYNCDIPPGWTIIDFNKACDKISLNEIKIKQKEYLAKGKYPVVDQGQELIGGYFDEGRFIVPLNPPYIVFGDHTKVKKYINFKFIAGADGIKVLKSKEFYNSKLLFYFLHVIKIPDKGYARHFQFLEKSEIPLPPPHEQHRIVAKIEELFSELDKGVEALKTAQQQLKVYRQAVLKWAFEGKLTEEWRKQQKDLPTAAQLLEQIKTEREKRAKATGKKLKPINPLAEEELAVLPDLPEHWHWIRFGEIIESFKRGPFGSAIKKEFFVPYGYKVYEQKNAIYKSEKLGNYYIDDHKFKELSGFEVLEGDYIVSCSGTIGKLFRLPANSPKGVINQALLRIRIYDNVLLHKYFSNIFESLNFQQKIIDDAKGSAMQNLAGVKEMDLVPFPICSVSEQDAIAQEIETRLSVADKLEETITQSLQLAEALRQSILKRAFAGKLVPQDPNDEPASRLLERIKAEKAAQTPVQKTRKKKATL